MATRDYSSIYSIKDFAINQIAPKYFDLNVVNQLNAGLLGYITELIGNTTEDSFNSVSTFIKEIFPNTAVIPESIYNYAALFQLNNLFATPADMSVVLFVSEKDIISLGQNKGSFYEFILDSDLVIDVEGQQFMLDYDVIIDCKPYKGDYIFTATYDLNFENFLSDVSNPYIKLKRIKYSNTNYLGLFVKVRRINKFEQPEYIINNDKINLPTLSFNYNDQLANFEVFYKESNSNEYSQLTKRLINTSPLTTPFCFYKFKNDNEIELSFTSRDKYFQPKFNSEIIIRVFTTTGTKGNKPLYTGTSISVIPKSNKYDYNNNLAMFAIVQSESSNGEDSLTLDDLREIIVEKFSTVDSYTNENDLQMYFSNFKYKYGNEILFIKRRDDAFERLFSAFALMKDENKDIYPTNTLHLDLNLTDFDIEYEQSDMYILKAGHIFKYKDSSIDTAVTIPNKMLKDDLTVLTDKFVYTNPFLMTLSKNPTIVGFYMNSINDRLLLDYSYVNNDSIIQFICNSVLITRNSLIGEDTYKLTIIVAPTTTLDKPIVDANGIDLGRIKIKCVIEDETSQEFCYTDFTLVSSNVANNIYTFETDIKTDDYMTMTQQIRAFNLKDINSGEVIDVKLIPMLDCNINIYTFYKYDDMVLAHKFQHITELENYSMTNMYTMKDSKINFMTPMNIMRSKVKYNDLGSGNYNVTLSFIPFVKADTMKDTTLYSYFMNNLTLQYSYIQSSLDKITNNYSIDMKFYNTYGKSKNFVVGDNKALLDRVNCSIEFKLCTTIGTDENTLVRDIKIFIKNYIEGILNKGYNVIYIFDLIKELGNNFSGIKYLTFVGINGYDSSIQVIENESTDINTLSKDQRKNYVPEFLTIKTDDIIIDVIYN